MTYPKRLIEVDLPIKRISINARREKSIRHGHISTLHIWWARRPLAACRAVICASLWPDPADENCPESFRNIVRLEMANWAKEHSSLLSKESFPRFNAVSKNQAKLKDNLELRKALLDFIADFSNWDNSAKQEFLDTSRTLTQAAHEALGYTHGTRPLVIDPFAGGGSIPLEALRIGADAFASDLNPIPVLLNKVVLEYIPKYGQRLAAEILKWGSWINKKAEEELAGFYPKSQDTSTPVTYLWARTIKCEGPSCGAEIPLIRSLWLAKKGNRSVALQLIPNAKKRCVDFDIIIKTPDGWVRQDSPCDRIPNPSFDGTVKRGSATCPCCGYTTPVASVREQLKKHRGGANDALLFCVITTMDSVQGRKYRLPVNDDRLGIKRARAELLGRKNSYKGSLSLIPDEHLDIRGVRHTWAMIYGFETWDTFFTDRQQLAISTLFRLVKDVGEHLAAKDSFDKAVMTCLSLAVSRVTDYCSSLCSWHLTRELIGHTFARQALPMVWDFAEVNPFADTSGNFLGAIDWVSRVCRANMQISIPGIVQQSSATAHPLPSDSVDCFITDPPYYDAVPYAYLSDYFYVWLRRTLCNFETSLTSLTAVPKDEEIVVDRPHELSNSTHDIAYYECALTKAFAEGRRVLRPDGIGTIVFASKTTASWEAILKAVVDSGWIITGSWPIDTEMETRVSAQGQARLASSVHLVCRPRETQNGVVHSDEVGDWRDVLAELPRRIHEWMPRLAEEGVVGADAIFACLGPALEIFSRYSRVEKANGETVSLKEYLEHVWAVVAREALIQVFAGADTAGFAPDARLTAIWLWTLKAGEVPGDISNDDSDSDEEQDVERMSKKAGMAKGGFSMEYDAARKIAQGLGASLESLEGIVEIKGDTAYLLPVSERVSILFGKGHDKVESIGQSRRKKQIQPDLFGSTDAGADGDVDSIAIDDEFSLGETTLDQVHQSMLLFASGRSEAMKRFLVADGVGRDQKFWCLAQALSALYPSSSEEKRWVDGVLARKKGLGL